MRTKKKDGDEAEKEMTPTPEPAATPEPKRLTPVDVQQKEFRLAMRGYSEREVDEFLDLVTEEMARLYSENTRLRAQVETRGPVEGTAPASPPAPSAPPATPAALQAFVAREQEFLKQLAGLIQDHARAVKEARRRARDEDGPLIDLASTSADDVGSAARPAVAFETTGTGSGEEDRSVRELFWGED